MVDETQEERTKLSLEEFELNKFKERKRQDSIKKQLARFRKGESIFVTRKEQDIFENDSTLFKKFTPKGVTKFNKKKKKGMVLTSKSLFMK